MDPSDACYALISSFEGCQLQAYRDPVGILTIGYGHVGADVTEGLTITPEYAQTLLKSDVQWAANAVNTLVHVPLSQPQFDALTSFVYNLGVRAFAQSTLLALINKGQLQQAADQFELWIHAGGQVLPGLVRRRAAEMQLFLERDS
jgi:lysozyme